MASVLLAAAKGLLKSLNENSGAISAVAAAVSVIIAALYTFYTTRLWRVSIQHTAASMKLLIDMNLTPAWVMFLQQEGFEALHWSTTGDPKATDAAIMEWARQAAHVVSRTISISPRYLR